MDDTIISKDMIRAKAWTAVQRGAGRDDHGFNAGAPAIATWQAAWDECNGKLVQTLHAEGTPP